MPPKSFDTQDSDLSLLEGDKVLEKQQQQPKNDMINNSEEKEDDDSIRSWLDTKMLFAQSVILLEEEKQDGSSTAPVSVLISSIQERIKIMDKLMDESDKWRNDSEEEKNGVTTEIREQLIWAMEEWEELDALDQKNVTQTDSLYDKLQNMKEAQSSGFIRDNKKQTQQQPAVPKLRPSQSRRIHSKVPCEIDRFGNILPTSNVITTTQPKVVAKLSPATLINKTAPSKSSNGNSFTKKLCRFLGL